MSERLIDRIRKLERIVKEQNEQIKLLTERTVIRKKPETVTPRPSQNKRNYSPSTGTGLGKIYGQDGNVIWNNSELAMPGYGKTIPTPTKGYNKHSHSRYSGGALDIDTLELVEYKKDNAGQLVDSNGDPLNKHCQNHWKTQPVIETENGIQKIGNLEISFDTETRTWKAGSSNLIDVKNTYLVEYEWVDGDGNVVDSDTEGATRRIALDSNGNQKKAPLLHDSSSDSNENLDKTQVVWDEGSETWRFYAVLKPYLEEE